MSEDFNLLHLFVGPGCVLQGHVYPFLAYLALEPRNVARLSGLPELVHLGGCRVVHFDPAACDELDALVAARLHIGAGDDVGLVGCPPRDVLVLLA